VLSFLLTAGCATILAEYLLSRLKRGFGFHGGGDRRQLPDLRCSVLMAGAVSQPYAPA